MNGARNIALFVAWAVFLASLFAFQLEVQKSMAAQGGPPVPQWLQWIFDMGAVGLLVWHGAWVTGIAYAWFSVIRSAAWVRATKE